ncbi:MAG: MFS transporter [Pirellulales bacterium]|nr:MFS transporter [Pirellulales bacterium]
MSDAPPGGSDLSHKPLLEQVRSLGRVFWVANWIELIERLAYCGVRVIAPLFIVAAFEQGGPELTQIQKGDIFAVWAVIQSFVPILSGGFADRFGFRLNIACSIVLTVLGYLLMGHSVMLAETWAGMPLREARTLGTDHAYGLLFAGTTLVAFGTAIFKPGVQGLIASQIPRSAASLAWGIFYQVVNIGGSFGPLAAGPLRNRFGWQSVFLVCAGALTLNFIPLFFLREPAREPDPNRVSNPFTLLYRAMRGLLEPRLFFFTISFAGFWLMYNQIFDVLPNFIDDWVDSRGPAAVLIAILGESRVPIVGGGNLPQEWILLVNYVLISTSAFAVAYYMGRMRSLTAIVLGIALAAASTHALGWTMNAWWIIAAIAAFSFGEMMAGPTQFRYLAGIAPPGKEGQFMGYLGFTNGIGWAIGSILGGHLYEHWGDKAVLARRYLIEHENLSRAAVDAVTKNDLMPHFEKTLGVDAWEARRVLWDTYSPYSIWLVFTLIGVGSLVALLAYNYVVRAAEANPGHGFNVHGRVWTRAFLFPICAGFAAATAVLWWQFGIRSPGMVLITGFFWLLAAVSLVPEDKAAT